MKIVVIGGSGLIGSKLVALLRNRGQDVVAASPGSGVDSATGTGLTQALAGAQTVVDVTNSPSMEDQAVLNFFEASGHHLIAAEQAAGVRHHLTLSIVGADRLPDSGYLRAKVAQETIVKTSGIPYTLVRATQFVEFMSRVAEYFSDGDVLRVPPAGIRPIVSDEVVTALADLTLSPPRNATVEVAGPDELQFDELIRCVLAKNSDPRAVIADPHARYFGTELRQDSLLPQSPRPLMGATRFADWLARSVAPV